LRGWFNEVCYCNGYNNLYSPQLTCADATTGSIKSMVHHYGDMTAQMLIDSAVATIHSNGTVHLPQHGWILFLEITNNTVVAVSTKGKSKNPMLTGICVGIICIVALLLLLVFTVGLVYRIYKRYIISFNLYSLILCKCGYIVTYYKEQNKAYTLYYRVAHNKENDCSGFISYSIVSSHHCINVLTTTYALLH